MPVKGSFALFLQGNMKGLPGMLENTRDEGLDALEKTIKRFTPVDTGELRKSIHQENKRRSGPYQYEGTVATEVDYARSVEYGAAPHIITPNDKKALRFGGEFAKEIVHPGFVGAHMFLIGTRTFERLELEPIMKKNWKKLMLESTVTGNLR